MTIERIVGVVRVISVVGADAYIRDTEGKDYLAPGAGRRVVEGGLYFLDQLALPTFTPATPSAWPAPLEAGRVERVEPDRVWIRRGDIVTSTPTDPTLPIKKGWTIEYMPGIGVTRVISKSHSTRGKSILDELDGRTDARRFRRTPDASWPTMADFVGPSSVTRQARDLIALPFERAELFEQIKAPMIRGILFAGPPGTGKTLLARIIAAEIGAALYLVNGPDVGDSLYGNSERTLRNIFSAASSEKKGRAIVFFDELDSIAPARGGDTHDVDRRIVTALLTALDGVDDNAHVVVIATTNRPGDLDPALTRLGRFDRVVDFALPDAVQRVQLLVRSGAGITHEQIDFARFAALTEDWSGAELTATWREAQIAAVRDGRGVIIEEDFARAVQLIDEQRAIRERDGKRGK